MLCLHLFQFGLSVMSRCFSFICLIILLGKFGEAFLFSNGDIAPVDPVLIVGSNLTLTCTLSSTYNSSINSTDMFFSVKKSDFTESIFPNDTYVWPTSRSLSLVLFNLQVNNSGQFNCYIRNFSGWITATVVNVTTPPEPVQKITCISENFRDMNCSWCPEQQQSDDVTWELNYRRGNEEGSRVCPGTSPTGCWCYFCFVTNDLNCPQNPNQTFIRFFDYKMNITTIKWFGKRNFTVVNAQEFLVQADESIVKPDLVRHLNVTSVNVTILRASWLYPIDLLPPLPMLSYQLSWFSDDSSNLQTVNVSITDNADISYNIVDLHPYTNYTVLVRSKPFNVVQMTTEGFWSEYAFQVAQTPISVPSRGPVMPIGSFRVPPVSVDASMVAIFWQPLNPLDMNGPILGYNIKYRSYNYTVSGGGSQAMNLSIDPREQSLIEVSAFTSAGSSPPTNFLLEAAAKAPQLPEKVVAEWTSDRRKMNFWWSLKTDDGSSQVFSPTSFTFFYCNGRYENPTQCDYNAVLHNITLPGDSRNFTFGNVASGLVYSLSANVGNSSSGMTSWICAYYYDMPPAKQLFSFRADRQSADQLTLVWIPSGCDMQSPSGQIASYIIQWKSDANDDLNNITHLNNISPGLQDSYSITNLKSDTKYTVTMTALSRIGLSGEKFTADISTGKSDPFAAWLIVILTILASAFLVSVGLLMWFGKM